MTGCRKNVFHLFELIVVCPTVKAVNNAGNQTLHTVLTREGAPDVILLNGYLIEQLGIHAVEEGRNIRNFPFIYFVFRHSRVVLMGISHSHKNFFCDVPVALRCLLEELQRVVVQVITNDNAANAVYKRIQEFVCQLSLRQDQVPDFLKIGSGGLRDPHAQLGSDGVDHR